MKFIESQEALLITVFVNVL